MQTLSYELSSLVVYTSELYICKYLIGYAMGLSKLQQQLKKKQKEAKEVNNYLK